MYRKIIFSKNLARFIAKYAVDANLFQLGYSIQKHARSKGAAPVGGTGANFEKKKM